jgi:hypothetical protein
MADGQGTAALTWQMLEWIGERPRSYAETLEAWKTSCPRLTIWEDAITGGLVRVERGAVVLTPIGRERLETLGRSERGIADAGDDCHEHDRRNHDAIHDEDPVRVAAHVAEQPLDREQPAPEGRKRSDEERPAPSTR